MVTTEKPGREERTVSCVPGAQAAAQERGLGNGTSEIEDAKRIDAREGLAYRPRRRKAPGQLDGRSE